MCEFLWSDPEEISDWESNPRGAGVIFGSQLVDKFLKTNNITFSKIDFLTDKNESGSIIITKVFIYTSCSKEKIEEIIGNSSEYEVEVIDE